MIVPVGSLGSILLLAIMASPIHAWESFFDEVSSFLRSVERQSDTRHASESFTHYVLEKITVYMSSINLLLHHMRETTADTNVTRLDRSWPISPYFRFHLNAGCSLSTSTNHCT